jgi:glycosyltransferase involved in cell wall biosynthesis
MATEATRILLVHQGKASLPELVAYRDHFQNRGYQCRAITWDRLHRDQALPDTVLWLFMGLYPHNYRAGFVVHDYRSLSTGRLPRLKDRVKRRFNGKPDLRVFLNPGVRDALDFRDGIPSTLIDMGIPDSLWAYRAPVPPAFDFVYVGDVSRERASDRMIERFLARYGDRRSLLLVGPCEPAIRNRFQDRANLHFAGRLPQEQVFAQVQRADIGLCFIPDRYPYSLQTPTKLLEYAALGRRIVANDLASTREAAERLGIRLRLMAGYGFPPEAELATLEDNRHLDPTSLSWERAIRTAGLERYLPPCARA